jgi:hypothetical protein
MHFPFQYYKNFIGITDDTLQIIQEVRKECIYNDFMNNGQSDHNLFCITFLKDFIKILEGDDKTKVTMLFYPLLDELLIYINENKAHDYYRKKEVIDKLYLDTKNLIKSLISEGNELSKQVMYKLKDDFYNYYCNNIYMYDVIGNKIMYDDRLCPLLLKFPCGNILKINKLLFPYFDCFKCENLEGEHLCNYDYECLETIITYFFTGKYDRDYVKVNCAKLMLGINKLGFDCDINILAKTPPDFYATFTYVISDFLEKNIENLLPEIFKNNTFENFLSQNEIFLNMSNKYYYELTENIVKFLLSLVSIDNDDSTNVKYDITQLLTSSFYMNNVLKLSTHWDFINNSDIVDIIPEVLLEHKVLGRLNDSNKIKLGIKYENYDYLERNKLLENIQCINIITEKIFEKPEIVSRMSFYDKILIGIKYKKFEYLNTLLLENTLFSRNTLIRIANSYKSFDIEHYQKWEYLELKLRGKHCESPAMLHDVKKQECFSYIHSFNPNDDRNIVVFNLVGYVVNIITNHLDNIVGIILKLGQKHKLDTSKKIFIGDTYDNTTRYNIFGITELWAYTNNKCEEKHKVNYLKNWDAYNYKYGAIYLNNDDIIRIGINNLKCGNSIFVDKEL